MLFVALARLDMYRPRCPRPLIDEEDVERGILDPFEAASGLSEDLERAERVSPDEAVVERPLAASRPPSLARRFFETSSFF